MEVDTDDSIFGDLEDQCTCWVCFEIFEEPVTLHCGHSFCKSCAHKVLIKNPCCPFCRKPFTDPLPAVNKAVEELVARFLNKQNNNKNVKMEDRPSIAQNSFLLSLPNEVIFDILSYLPPKEIGRSSRICRDLKDVTNDGWLWRSICQAKFPFCSVDRYGKNWKHCFIARSNITVGWEEGKASQFEVTTLRGHKNYVECFRLYRNNIVSGSADNTLKIWKVTSDDPIHTLAGHNGMVNCVQFNEVRVVSGSQDRTVRIWDTKSGLSIKSMYHNSSVNHLQFDDSKIVSCSDDNQVKVWDVKDGSTITTLTGHQYGVSKIEFDNSTHLVVTAGRDTTKVWDLRTGNVVHDLQQVVNKNFQLSSNGVIVYNNTQGQLKSFDTKAGTHRDFTGSNVNYGWNNGITCVTTDGKIVATADSAGTIKTFNMATHTLIHTMSEHKQAVNSIQLGESKLVSGSADNSIKVWDLKNGKRMYTLLGGSLQKRANNPDHPTRLGCSHLEFDDSRITASFASLLRVYDFELYHPPQK